MYVHPSAMTPEWLKQGALLQSAWAVTETSLSNLFTGVLPNYHGSLGCCSEYLLSATAWLQVSLLCGHNRSMAVRACQNAVHHFLRYTPHDTVLSQKWIAYLAHEMPCGRVEVRHRLWMGCMLMRCGQVTIIPPGTYLIMVGTLTGVQIGPVVDVFLLVSQCPHQRAGGGGLGQGGP